MWMCRLFENLQKIRMAGIYGCVKSTPYYDLCSPVLKITIRRFESKLPIVFKKVLPDFQSQGVGHDRVQEGNS